MANRSEVGRTGRTWIILFGVFLLLDFVLILVMLATDQNLQTDFMTVSKYYAHWYGLLAEGILTLLVGLAVIFNATARSMWSDLPKRVKTVVTAALVWTILAVLADLAIVFTWSQVGAPSMSWFAMYLFDTPSPVTTGYIPWLYDALIAVYILTAILGILAWTQVRKWGSAPEST
ncbi:MAG: hypothetical protein L3K02_01490 [Thermoplasmata archaeon]|nr:hypothetical protein [Thermoplasmata archaeon]